MRTIACLFAALAALLTASLGPSGAALAQSSGDDVFFSQPVPVPGYRGLYANSEKDAKDLRNVLIIAQLASRLPDAINGANPCATADIYNKITAAGIRARALKSTALQPAFYESLEFKCRLLITAQFDLDLLAPPDTTRPDVLPDEKMFSSRTKSVTISAMVTDDSGRLLRVQLRLGGQNYAMKPVTGSANVNGRFTIDVTIGNNFLDQSAEIVARDFAGNERVVPVAFRRNPTCGPPAPYARPQVEDIQQNLTCAGFDTKGVDGGVGPNTCAAIGDYLGARYDAFNVGKIGWDDLQKSAAAACEKNKPVEIDATRTLTRDAQTARLRVGLVNAGTTRQINVVAQNGSVLASISYVNAPVDLTLPMPPVGTQRDVTIQALGGSDDVGLTLLQTAPLRLIRPGVDLRVNPNGDIRADAEFTPVTAQIVTGLSALSGLRVRSDLQPPTLTGLVNGRATLQVVMPEPGQTVSAMIEAVGKDGSTLDRVGLRLTRAPVAIVLSPQGPLTSPEPDQQVQLRVVSGAALVARLRIDGSGAQAGTLLFTGSPMALRLQMPDAGQTGDTTIVALGADGTPLDQATIRLISSAVAPTPVDEPDDLGTADPVDTEQPPDTPTPPVELAVTSPDGFDIDATTTRVRVEVINPAGTRSLTIQEIGGDLALDPQVYAGDAWTSFLPMPDPGGTRIFIVEARDANGTILAQSRIDLFRPAAPFPWVPIFGGVLVLALGGIAVRQVMHWIKPPIAKITLRSVPDETPAFSVSPLAPATIGLRTQPDTTPEFTFDPPAHAMEPHHD